jgi:hypothetical protein
MQSDLKKNDEDSDAAMDKILSEFMAFLFILTVLVVCFRILFR